MRTLCESLLEQPPPKGLADLIDYLIGSLLPIPPGNVQNSPAKQRQNVLSHSIMLPPNFAGVISVSVGLYRELVGWPSEIKNCGDSPLMADLIL